ncbi:MAG TPA: SDR family oxidoreductase [Chloroflexota bacterium]|jgi:NAD(P)-dependent dehydrogenase (short-subunit alcohol dehydrogenase family)
MTAKTQKVALITGASRGLGLEIARVYAREGFCLIISARGEDALSAAARELALHTEVLAIPGDVAIGSHASALVRDGLNRFGHIDVLVNNASELGPTPMPPLETFPLDGFRAVLEVNVLAPLRLAQLVLPEMKSRGYGVIINVTSDAAMEAYPGWGGYAASKAALEHISRTLTVELEGTGIAVFAIDPGDMDTQMHRDAEPGTDLSSLLTPDVPAPAFLRLAQRAIASGRFKALDLIAEGQHAGA